MVKDLSICKLNDVYGKLLTAKQSELIRQFYYDDLSLGEIAENEGITRQAAHDAIAKGVNALKGYEDALKLGLIYDNLLSIGPNMSKEEVLAKVQIILDLREE